MFFEPTNSTDPIESIGSIQAMETIEARGSVDFIDVHVFKIHF